MSEKGYNLFAILSIIFTFVIYPVGLIFGIIALNQIKKTGEKGKGLAMVSIISGLVLVTIVIIGIVWAVVSGIVKTSAV